MTLNEFVIDTNDIQALVDIATDGTSKEFGRIIDWIANARSRPHILIAEREQVLYEIGKKIAEAYKQGYQDAVELYCLVDDDDLAPTPPAGDPP